MAREWEKFLWLSDQDQAHLALNPHRTPVGFGKKPALLMIDLYRAVFGDEPTPLLEAFETWPSTCGLAAWESLPAIQELLAEAREAGIPVVYTTGLGPGEHGIAAGTRPHMRGRRPTDDPAAQERRRRSMDIIDEVAPLPGETVLRKAAASAFFGTPLMTHLTRLGVDTLIVAGESTSGCVRASVVDGASYGYRMLVVEDCVFDRHQACHAMSLFDLEQKYADVIPLSSAKDQMRAWSASGNGVLTAGA